MAHRTTVDVCYPTGLLELFVPIQQCAERGKSCLSLGNLLPMNVKLYLSLVLEVLYL
jgi:hypothetical protein